MRERFLIEESDAHFARDTDGEDETLIVDALNSFATSDPESAASNIQILRFDRTIELKGGDQQAAIIKGHEEARSTPKSL